MQTHVNGALLATVIVGSMRRISQLDELGQRVHQEAIMIAFAATGILVTLGGLLERTGMPAVSCCRSRRRRTCARSARRCAKAATATSRCARCRGSITFQPATTGLPGEYAKIETTFAPAALDTLGEWLAARAPRAMRNSLRVLRAERQWSQGSSPSGSASRARR